MTIPIKDSHSFYICTKANAYAFIASSTATAVATVAPTIGLLPFLKATLYFDFLRLACSINEENH